MSDPVFEAFRRKLADVVTVAINSGSPVSARRYDLHCPLSCATDAPRCVRYTEFGIEYRDAVAFAYAFDGESKRTGPYAELGRLYRARFP